MPVYEYKCSKCGAVTEKLSNFKTPDMIFLECCGEPAYKIMSKISGFKFNGSGFYATDYCKQNCEEDCNKDKE